MVTADTDKNINLPFRCQHLFPTCLKPVWVIWEKRINQHRKGVDFERPNCSLTEQTTSLLFSGRGVQVYTV